MDNIIEIPNIGKPQCKITKRGCAYFDTPPYFF